MGRNKMNTTDKTIVFLVVMMVFTFIIAIFTKSDIVYGTNLGISLSIIAIIIMDIVNKMDKIK